MISTTINNNTIQYRCAGKDCSNIGNILLRIKFIDKTGYFCSFCADDLLHNELASVEESKSHIEASNCHLKSSSKDFSWVARWTRCTESCPYPNKEKK